MLALNNCTQTHSVKRRLDQLNQINELISEGADDYWTAYDSHVIVFVGHSIVGRKICLTETLTLRKAPKDKLRVSQRAMEREMLRTSLRDKNNEMNESDARQEWQIVEMAVSRTQSSNCRQPLVWANFELEAIQSGNATGEIRRRRQTIYKTRTAEDREEWWKLKETTFFSMENDTANYDSFVEYQGN